MPQDRDSNRAGDGRPGLRGVHGGTKTDAVEPTIAINAPAADVGLDTSPPFR